MITAVITTFNDERRLGATLATLAPAPLDALVREVIIADAASTDDTLAVAEAVGARAIVGEGALDRACREARQPWLLILPAGARLELGWEVAARGHIRRQPAAGGWFRLSLADDGAAARLDEAWANFAARWLGRPRPRQGLLIAARQWGKPGTPTCGLAARILVGRAEA